MFWHTSKIKTLKDAQTTEYVAGAAGATSTPAFYGRVFNQLFGMKARFIVGYPGQNEILHAMESGEVEAMASPFWSSLKASRPTWSKEGKIRFLFQYGGSGPHPELKDVPLGGRSPQERSRQDPAGGGRLRRLGSGRPFTAPPGIPADRLTALRTALLATFKDKAFIADCAKQRLRCADPKSGEGARRAGRPRLWRARRRAQTADRDVSGDQVTRESQAPHGEERRVSARLDALWAERLNHGGVFRTRVLRDPRAPRGPSGLTPEHVEIDFITR